MGLSNREALKKLEKEIMPPIRECLEEIRDSIVSIQTFHAIVNRLTNSAAAQFLNLSNAQNTSELSQDHKAWLTGSIIANLNSALPLKYLWIVVAICIKETNDIKIGVLSRKCIPGIHDLLRTRVVPIIFLKTKGELKKLLRNQIKPEVKFVDFPPKAPPF